MRGMVEQRNVAICNARPSLRAWEAGHAPMGGLGQTVGLGILILLPKQIFEK
jgi:hypothetical protein